MISATYIGKSGKDYWGALGMEWILGDLEVSKTDGWDVLVHPKGDKSVSAILHKSLFDIKGTPKETNRTLSQ